MGELAAMMDEYAKDQSLFRLEEQAKACQAGPVGTAGSVALPTLGLAARNLRHRLSPGGPIRFLCAGKRIRSPSPCFDV